MRKVSGSVACNNKIFGDPIVGTVKECHCSADAGHYERDIAERNVKTC